MEFLFELLQQLSVFLVIAYLISKTPLFIPLTSVSGHLSHRITAYLLFSLFCILGTYFGLTVEGAIANTRAIGAVLGGLLAGPFVGTAVGLTGGLHRYAMGGFTDLACAISTTAEGLLGGLIHCYYLRRGLEDKIFKPGVAFVVVLIAEMLQMTIILLVAEPFAKALALVQIIALPMLAANALGAALFMFIIQDRKNLHEKYSTAFSSKPLKIAERTVGIFNGGFNQQTAQKIAQIIYEETGVGAVAITDREKILAFIGIGEDHHLPDTTISSDYTKHAIANCELVYADGYNQTYQCSLDRKCRLGSVLVIPLLSGDDQAIGTIKLYEPKHKLFSSINKTLGEGLAKLLSNQILTGRYLQQEALLMQMQLRLLQAQVNPHFLFNALNTISAVIRRDPDKARELLLHLAQFFRRNLKHNIESVTIKEELAHVRAYLEVEMARFPDRLQVEFLVEQALYDLQVPTFTLQPLVENAIKHGTATLLENGRIEINGCLIKDRNEPLVKLQVIDNAGTYLQKENSSGLGLEIVDKRIKNRFGQLYGLQIHCKPGISTTAEIIFPLPTS